MRLKDQKLIDIEMVFIHLVTPIFILFITSISMSINKNVHHQYVNGVKIALHLGIHWQK